MPQQSKECTCWKFVFHARGWGRHWGLGKENTQVDEWVGQPHFCNLPHCRGLYRIPASYTSPWSRVWSMGLPSTSSYCLQLVGVLTVHQSLPSLLRAWRGQGKDRTGSWVTVRCSQKAFSCSPIIPSSLPSLHLSCSAVLCATRLLQIRNGQRILRSSIFTIQITQGRNKSSLMLLGTVAPLSIRCELWEPTARYSCP